MSNNTKINKIQDATCTNLYRQILPHDEGDRKAFRELDICTLTALYGDSFDKTREMIYFAIYTPDSPTKENLFIDIKSLKIYCIPLYTYNNFRKHINTNNDYKNRYIATVGGQEYLNIFKYVANFTGGGDINNSTELQKFNIFMKNKHRMTILQQGKEYSVQYGYC